jgi:AraC-like DNA-binding protein
MRTRLPILPPQSRALTRLPTLTAGRFDLGGIGAATETGPGYDWDNRRRAPAILLQHTLAGEGRLEEREPGLTHTLGPGRAMLLEMPSATRYFAPHGRDWRFIWAMLVGDAALAHGRQLIREHGRVLSLPTSSPPIALLIDLHRRLTHAAEEPDELDLQLEVHRLLIELRRALRPSGEGVPEPIAAARDLMDERFDDPSLNVEQLSDVAGYSKYHFSRLFRQHVGATPYQHLLRRRVRHALDLLTTTDEPIKRIALRCGFKDVSWFCATFRKQTGTSPAAARRQHRALAGR